MQNRDQGDISLQDELSYFGQLFKHHINGAKQATLRWVEAGEVDWENKTMTAIGENDLPFHDVLLGVGMMAVKPVIGTECLIAIVEGDEATAFLLYANEAEEIAFNGGELGGLVKINELKTQLNKLTKRVDDIINALNQGVPVPSDGGAAIQMAVKAALALIVDKEDFNNIEDTKINH